MESKWSLWSFPFTRIFLLVKINGLEVNIILCKMIGLLSLWISGKNQLVFTDFSP